MLKLIITAGLIAGGILLADILNRTDFAFVLAIPAIVYLVLATPYVIRDIVKLVRK